MPTYINIFRIGCLGQNIKNIFTKSDIYLSIYIPWPFPPSLGGSRQHKRNNKTMGISLRSSSNDEGPSRVWMVLLEQHSPNQITG